LNAFFKKNTRALYAPLSRYLSLLLSVCSRARVCVRAFVNVAYSADKKNDITQKLKRAKLDTQKKVKSKNKKSH